MSFNDTVRESPAHVDASTEQSSLKIFTMGKERQNPHTVQQTKGKKEELVPASPSNEAQTLQNQTWLLIARENIFLTPECRQVAVGRMELVKEQKLPPLVWVEPAQFPIEVIFPGQTLSNWTEHTQISTADVTV